MEDLVKNWSYLKCSQDVGLNLVRVLQDQCSL